MNRRLVILEYARWLAFIPSLWLSTLVHKAVIKTFGIMPEITSLNPSPETISKAAALWCGAEVIAIIATVIFAVLLGPRRGSLFQLFMIAVVYAVVGTFNLINIDMWQLPALKHAVLVDNWTGIVLSIAFFLCGVFIERKHSTQSMTAAQITKH